MNWLFQIGFLQLEDEIVFDVNRGNNTVEYDEDYDAYITVEVENEQPTGTLIVDKSIVIREDVDTSLVDISDLSVIEFTLTAKEDILDMSDGSIIYEKGKIVKVFNIDKDGNYTLPDLPLGIYELQETRTLDGLVLNDKKYEVKFEQKDLITKVYEEKKNITNDSTIFEFSKKAITGDDELEGATLIVLDENENIIDTWESGKDTHKIEGLVVGKTYTLRETITPDEYVQATDIKFKVENTKEIQKVEMIDKIVEISKQDISGNELEGATLVVTNIKTKNIVDKWISGKEPHKVTGLIEGETYNLHEEIVVDGYVKASDIQFTVTDDKETQKVVMVDKVVKIIKTDLVAGEEIEGAELKVVDEDGNTIDEWISTKEPHIVNGLEENKKYTLIEKTAPYGYEITEKIAFTVTDDKETQLIEMKDMPILTDVTLVKINSKTQEVIKADFTFGIYKDENCTDLIQEVTSNNENGTVTFKDLRYGTYFIKEIKAPIGFIKSDKVIKLEIDDKGVFVDNALVEKNDNIYSFKFENTPIETPNTGDGSHLKLISGIMLLSILGITVLVLRLYKKNKQNK